MKLAEILQSLHQMQKETTRLLFEVPVNESEVLRKAVTRADLALGNAASAVRQQVSGTPETVAEIGRERRSVVAAPRKPTRPAEAYAAASQPAVSNGTKQSLGQDRVSLDEELLDNEDLIHLRHRDWGYLDVIQHPDDRPTHRAAGPVAG